MARPYDLDVRYLITCGFDSTSQVNEELFNLSLPLIQNTDFDRQLNYIETRVPPGIMIQIDKQRFSVNFIKWMRELDLEEFWRAHKHYAVDYDKAPLIRRLTVDLHQDVQLRTAINGLLMKGVPVPDMLPLLTSRYSMVQKEVHLALYKKYFFDPQVMSRGDWKAFLRQTDGHEQHIYFTALTEDLDAVKTELEMPSQVKTSEMLQYLLSKSYRKAKQFLSVDTPKASAEARAWTDQVIRLVDKYEKYRTTDSTDFAKSLQMEFEFVDTEMPTPDPETLGNLTAQIKGREMSGKEKDTPAE